MVLPKNSLFITNKKDAAKSYLAESLFQLDGITAVYLEKDFLSVTKDKAASWKHVKTPVLQKIMEHYLKNLPVMKEEELVEAGNPKGKNKIEKQIIELLETRVQPAVAQDGGSITFHSFKEGVVYLNMRGACSGCPSSTITLKQGIESLLQHYIPEVREVIPVS